MAEDGVQRRLAAILAADVVGYSWMMRIGEVATEPEFYIHRWIWTEHSTNISCISKMRMRQLTGRRPIVRIQIGVAEFAASTVDPNSRRIPVPGRAITAGAG